MGIPSGLSLGWVSVAEAQLFYRIHDGDRKGLGLPKMLGASLPIRRGRHRMAKPTGV